VGLVGFVGFIGFIGFIADGFCRLCLQDGSLRSPAEPSFPNVPPRARE
jgi:hypothetical protein